MNTITTANFNFPNQKAVYREKLGKFMTLRMNY
jgi:hypothetical protein